MEINIKSYIAGLITMFLLACGTLVYAETNQNINAIFDRVQLVVKGNSVSDQTLLYGGTTYVPIRATAEILGMEVAWDAATSTAYIDEWGTNRVFGEQSNPTFGGQTADNSDDPQLIPDAQPQNGQSTIYYKTYPAVPDFGKMAEMELTSNIDDEGSGRSSSIYSYVSTVNVAVAAEEYGKLLENNGFVKIDSGDVMNVYYMKANIVVIIAYNVSEDHVINIYVLETKKQ